MNKIGYSVLFVILVMSCINRMPKKQRVDCNRCDMELLVSPDNVDDLDVVGINNFLCTLSPSCSENIEFSEISNESLFKIFETHPQSALTVLERNKNILIEHILKELETPVNDRIDLQSVYLKVEATQGHSSIKEKVLQALLRAKEKTSTM